MALSNFCLFISIHSFLVSARKEPKEADIGEAFMPPPGVRYTLPYVPLP